MNLIVFSKQIQLSFLYSGTDFELELELDIQKTVIFPRENAYFRKTIYFRVRCYKVWLKGQKAMDPRSERVPMNDQIWMALGHSGGALGRSWGAPGALVGALGALLGHSWGALGALLGALGALLGRSWGGLGALLGALGRLLALLGNLGALLGRSWGARGRS